MSGYTILYYALMFVDPSYCIIRIYDFKAWLSPQADRAHLCLQ